MSAYVVNSDNNNFFPKAFFLHSFLPSVLFPCRSTLWLINQSIPLGQMFFFSGEEKCSHFFSPDSGDCRSRKMLKTSIFSLGLASVQPRMISDKFAMVHYGSVSRAQRGDRFHCCFRRAAPRFPTISGTGALCTTHG